MSEIEHMLVAIAGGISIGIVGMWLLWRFSSSTHSPVICKPQPAVTPEGFCEWVCPKPLGYLMQCCDCGLIHEVEFRVAKYEPRPGEEFVVCDDPDLQVQLRMRRLETAACHSLSGKCSDNHCAKTGRCAFPVNLDEPPICADTGAPKWPGNCWNVRCQLGGTCCRAPT